MNKNVLPADLHDVTPEEMFSLIHLNTVTLTSDMCKISNDGVLSLNANGRMAINNNKAFKYYEVIVPEKIDGKTITSIKNASFKGLDSVVSVKLPETVTSIGMYTFCGCTSLIKINIPNKVNKIGKGAFEYCKNLESEISLKNVLHIENNTFKECHKIPSVILSNNIVSIDNHAFDNCRHLKKLYLPENIKAIGTRTFRNCYGLNIYYNGTQKQLDEVLSPETKEYLAKYKTTFTPVKGIDLNDALESASNLNAINKTDKYENNDEIER